MSYQPAPIKTEGDSASGSEQGQVMLGVRRDADTTAVAAGQVKVKLSRTV